MFQQVLRKPIFWLVALNVLVIGGAWWWWADRQQPDMTEVMKLNLEGVGWMDKFEYAKAIEAFEKVVDKAPQWIPGKINLSIALLNFGGDKKEKSHTNRAVELLRAVLKEDPKNPYGNHCLGIIYVSEGKLEEARPYLAKVTEVDPNDPDGWFWLGRTMVSNEEDKRSELAKKRLECMTRAVELSPYHKGALYGWWDELRFIDPEAADKLLKKGQGLEAAEWHTLTKAIYSAMGKYALAVAGGENGLGKYAMVIGRTDGKVNASAMQSLPAFDTNPDFKVLLGAGVRWAGAKDFDSGLEGDLYRAIRQRFGSALVILDYDQDGKLDLYLAGGVVENGMVRDVLLHNEGKGSFKDVTRDMGLADHPPSWGAYAADYDNDGFPDLLLMGPLHPRLFRNREKSAVGFENVSKAAALDKLSGVFLGAAWVDLDQDGDLDFLLAQYAATAGAALDALKNAKDENKGGLAVFLNTGGSPPQTPEEVFAIVTKFKQSGELESLAKVDARLVNLAIADLDHDRDLDLLVVGDGQPVQVLLNDRLLQFHRGELPKDLIGDGPWNGILTLDSKQQERNDLLLVSPTKEGALLLNQSTPKEPFGKGFTKGVTNAPPLLQARTVDIDLDGLTDVLGLSSERTPVLLHNDGDRLVLTHIRFSRSESFKADGLAVAAGDIDGDYNPDVLLWSESKGLMLLRSLGNGNNAVQVQLTGRRWNKTLPVLRCNNDAVGVKIRVHAQSLVTGGEIATNFAGLGQSHQPLLFGIGKHSRADIIRLRWPDNVWQGEMNLPTKQSNRIAQDSRMPDSCPLLFTWDGERYVCICDFLGGGAIGEIMPDRSHRPPRPEESVKIESHQLKPKDGKLVLKISEPMDEVTYLDRVELVVVDHPADVKVYPEERFASTAPSQDLHAFSADRAIYALNARDHKGRDVTATIRHWDRNMVDGFLCRTWLGYAEDHYVELDFGDQLSKFDGKDRLFLCLAGWTDYPYPEAMWAAKQAEVPLHPPSLQRQTGDGQWETVIADLGFPAGRPRMMMVEVTGKVHGARCVMRIPTSMQVYWDQILLAPVGETVTSAELTRIAGHSGRLFNISKLPVSAAELTSGYVMQEFSPDGKQPTLYNFGKPDTAPVGRPSGRLTRFGNVKELLTDDDDRFVIFAAGDELTVIFDARKLAPLVDNWTRSYVLRTAGYCKSMSPFTATGGAIEPLPFRAMSNFPYGPKERYPQTPLHLDYLRTFQTRMVGNN